MKTIGFIGVGVMGKPMVKHLKEAGYEVSIYTRTKEKVLSLLDEGIIWCDTIKDCVKNKDIVMTMVGYPKDVEEVYFGKDGIIENVKKGCILIDFTTSSPRLAAKIYMQAKEKEVYSLDAPVSGGDIGAISASLSIMVGGDKEVFDKMIPIFNVLGKTIHFCGSAGNGQHVKMSNQIAIAGTIAGVCEAITYSKNVNMDLNIMMQCICNGAAGSWQLTNNGNNIINNNFEPGFYIKHFIKDMKIAREEMESQGIHLEVLDKVLNMYESLNENELGTQALIHYYNKG